MVLSYGYRTRVPDFARDLPWPGVQLLRLQDQRSGWAAAVQFEEGLGGAACPPEEGFASQRTHAQVTGIWCCHSCQNPPLALRGDSQHATWVEDPGILGANNVQMGRRLAKAPTAWASCLGKWPELSGASAWPASESTKASAARDPAFTCSPFSHALCALPCWKERSQRRGRGRGRNWGKGRNVTLLLVITAVEFSLFARPGAECFTAFPSYSSPYPVRKGLPPPPLHGGELRPEQVTCPGPPSWSVAQAALGQVIWLCLCET